ncbi:MAG: hypothetical protein ACD_75C00602G0002 [uncultured bacterium]|nr:MAG: hypothetical protein ACD_75C00602G0002 [uncultured bacterium]
MKNKLFPFNYKGVAGIITTLETDDAIGITGQQVDNFPLTFISPLRTNNNNTGHLHLLSEVNEHLS